MKVDFEAVKSFLIKELQAEMIYLFGSYAKRKERPDSDLDLAFLSSKEIDDYQRFLTAQKLASKLNIEVDLIDLKKPLQFLRHRLFRESCFMLKIKSRNRNLKC